MYSYLPTKVYRRHMTVSFLWLNNDIVLSNYENVSDCSQFGQTDTTTE